MKNQFLVVIFLLLVFETAADRFTSAAVSSAEHTQLPPELILQTGHIEKVESVVIGPNNLWIASASFDSTIIIWDLATGRELRSLRGHGGAVKSLACSTDGEVLASGGNDGIVRVWEVDSGKEITSFENQGGGIESITFSPDNKKMAYGDSSNTVIIVEVATGRLLAKLSGHTGIISALAFSPDGRSLASGSYDKTIRIWDVDSEKLTRTLPGHRGRIRVLHFNETGTVLASGSEDATVRLWDLPNKKKLGVLKGHKGVILALNFLSPEKLISADSYRTVNVWNISGKCELISSDGSDKEVSASDAQSATFNNDSSLLAFGNGDGTITVTKNGTMIRTLENHTTRFSSVSFSRDRRWLAAASFDKTVKRWDLQTGLSLPPLKGHSARVTAMVFHPDSRQIISADMDSMIRVWDILSGKCLRIFDGHARSISSLAISEKGKLLVSGSEDHTVGLWFLETKNKPHFLRGHRGEVTSVSISNDERFVASASLDATIKVWDLRTELPVFTIDAHAGEINALAFSPDGKLIASGGEDDMVHIWDAGSGRSLGTLVGHSGRIYALSFSPDEKKIVSSGLDKTIRTWTVAGAKEDRVLTGHAGAVFSISYSADGRFLSSASDDGSIVIWNPEAGLRLSTLISLKDTNDWLVVTPEGFFDGSQYAWRQLSWRFEKDTFNAKAVEVFFSEFWLPGLLADLLNKKGLPSSSNVSNKDRRQPELDLSLADAATGASGRSVSFQINVKRAPAGVKDMRLFRNGILIHVWHGDLFDKTSGCEAVTLLPNDSPSVRCRAKVNVVQGTNNFTTYAFNSSNVKSDDVTISIESNTPKRDGTLYVLAVGIDRYAATRAIPDGPGYDLNYAVADIDAIGQKLIEQQRAMNQRQYVDAKLISIDNENATKANILLALSRFVNDDKKAVFPSGGNVQFGNQLAKIKPLRPEDALVIYYAGHGTARCTLDGKSMQTNCDRFYLIPHDGFPVEKFTDAAARRQRLYENSISDEELSDVLETFDVGKMVMVIDACNSGAIEGEEPRRGPMNSRGLAQLAYEKGMVVLTASQSLQSAQEGLRVRDKQGNIVQIEHGLLTYSLLEALNNKDANIDEDEKLTDTEWLNYAVAHVPQLQLDAMKNRNAENRGFTDIGRKRAEIIFVNGDDKDLPPEKRSLQTPRLFVRREADLTPLIIASH